ncbi:DUF4279 domain-containing protein [Lusitaniella coriacea]|uniref:DUF4279 domain-containing protein n=1 Tax=Lusitaniella coriacea TaxID=1983105 RepID=UPI003CF58F44
MSKIKMSLRLHGELPPTEQINSILEFFPTKSLRKGQRVGKNRIQPTDVWILDLAKFECRGNKNEINAMEQQIQQAATTLQQLAPRLGFLNRSCCKVELYISTIREEDQGGFSLPGKILKAATAADLSSVEVSILVMLDDYEEPES